jgi:uncharacterized membrane protein YdjX (TVP38/TMEM64 family)
VIEQTAQVLNESPAKSAEPGRAQTPLRLILLGVVLVAAVLVVHLTPISAWLADVQQVRAALAGMGVWVYPVSVLAVALLVASGVPRLLFCAAGGMVFGFWIGLLITQVGTLLGHYAVFLFVRWGGRDWALRRWPRLRKWADLMHEQGVVGVILVRQLPAHAMLINVSLALSHVKHRHFLLGTIIGLLPEAIPATLVGAGLVKTSLKDSAGYIALAAGALALIWILCGYALREMRKGRRTSEELQDVKS